MSLFFKSFRQIDWAIIFTVILLCFIGLAAIYSVDLSRGDDAFLHTKKQLIALALGLVFLFLLASSNYKFLESFVPIIYWATIASLVAVLVFGKTIRGTTAWFSFGWFNFQPLELIKFTIILALGKYFASHPNLRFSLKAVLQSLFIVAVPVSLLLLQPDFGGSLLLLAIWFVMLIVFGVKKKHIALLLLISALLSSVAWFFVLRPYQKDRISTFINPTKDIERAGYNVRQSIIAIGAGRLMGRGLGFGSQSQLKFLPESQTDFIFAVIAEELGFVLTFTVLSLFGFLLYRFLRIAMFAHDDFDSLIVIGIATVFFLELLVNIGMNLGIMPVLGLTAPFLSYGGSSLLMHLIMSGVSLSIAKRV